jgi:hypothetical protein
MGIIWYIPVQYKLWTETGPEVLPAPEIIYIGILDIFNRSGLADSQVYNISQTQGQHNSIFSPGRGMKTEKSQEKQGNKYRPLHYAFRL